MKNLTLVLFTVSLLMIQNNVFAATHSAPVIDEGSESTRINLWIPGIFMKMAAEIAENHVDNDHLAAVDLIHKIGNTTICIREGEYYQARTDKKMTRKLNRMERQDYEALVSVISEGESVNISIRENKHGKIKRMVVLVDEKDETFVYVKMNCRLKMEDVAKVCNQYIEL